MVVVVVVVVVVPAYPEVGRWPSWPAAYGPAASRVGIDRERMWSWISDLGEFTEKLNGD